MELSSNSVNSPLLMLAERESDRAPDATGPRYGCRAVVAVAEFEIGPAPAALTALTR